MYVITYKLQIGTLVHRARSASDAIETMRLLRHGGASIDNIADRTGKRFSAGDIDALAELESETDASQAKRWPALLLARCRQFLERLGLWPGQPA